jgi:subtilase family serine protease
MKGEMMRRFERFAILMSFVACTVMAACLLWAPPLHAVDVTIKPHSQIPGRMTDPGQLALPKPDLQAGVVKVTPQHPGEGKMVTFEGNVMNYGEGPAAKPVVTLTVAGPAGVSFPVFRKQFNVTLNKNQGVTFVKKFKAAKHGNYTCTFSLDPARMIAETDDNNNVKQLAFKVDPLPDFIVCISNGKRPPVGGRRDIHAVVKNIGSGNGADYIKLRFYVEGKGTKTFDLLPINAGDSRKVTRSAKWSTAGTKTITAKIIYTKSEINKNNNEARGSYFVRLPHHDKYSAAPQIKCSNNKTFNDWEHCCH